MCRITRIQPTRQRDEAPAQLQDAAHGRTMLVRQLLELQQLRLRQKCGEGIVERVLQRPRRVAEDELRPHSLKFARRNRAVAVVPRKLRLLGILGAAFGEEGTNETVRIHARQQLRDQLTRERQRRRRLGHCEW
jgi:hypothetical protein